MSEPHKRGKISKRNAFEIEIESEIEVTTKRAENGEKKGNSFWNNGRRARRGAAN